MANDAGSSRLSSEQHAETGGGLRDHTPTTETVTTRRDPAEPCGECGHPRSDHAESGCSRLCPCLIFARVATSARPQQVEVPSATSFLPGCAGCGHSAAVSTCDCIRGCACTAVRHSQTPRCARCGCARPLHPGDGRCLAGASLNEDEGPCTCRRYLPPSSPAGAAPAGGQPLPASAFVKADAGKPRYSLMPPAAELRTVEVLTYGAAKYTRPGPNGTVITGAENWRNAPDAARYIDAALRHLAAYRSGEETDPESGKPHLAHAICSLAFALELREDGKPRGDRHDK